ncbi:hypothetical protein Agub_g11955 [Astrephomene gubernaculifera]|uniref:Uncharacterized protein n=1 Tax=Astrephomene gubernaculifera TaxID=47775 RepID=A0AAD3DXG8_9CHLO|nr:hypothetical protein Agub_g11955 [Astrephomene gubernaculifera]
MQAAQGIDLFSQVAGVGCSGGLTLVKGSLELSGLFLVQQYLRILLQNGYAVILVTAEQSLERYKYVTKKMGINLPSYQQSGHLICVEAPIATPGDSGHGSLRHIFTAVQHAVRQRPVQALGLAVLFDSLTVLASLCPSPEDWTGFLHYCCGTGGAFAASSQATTEEQQQQQPAEQRPQVPYCVIAGVYDDVPDDRAWLTSLEHRADVVVSVEPLPGRIADVDGVVTVTRRAVPQPAATPQQLPAPSGQATPSGGSAPGCAPLRQSLYFRAGELAIKWMQHVTARELL